jgi:TolB-like protein
MMCGVVALAMAVALAAAPGDMKLAAHGLTLTGMDASLAEGLTEHLAQSFKRVRVITARDIGALLGLERQKQLMGCNDAATNCMAELGNALGVQGVLLGELLKVGARVQINLRVLDPLNGQVMASYSEELDASDDLLRALARGAGRLEGQLLSDAPSAATSLRTYAAFPLGLGIAAGISGGVMLGLAASLYGQLTAAGMPGSFTDDPGQAVVRGRNFQISGIALLGVAAACLIVAGLLFIFGGAS